MLKGSEYNDCTPWKTERGKNMAREPYISILKDYSKLQR